jgi:hypothetical protein
MTEPPCTANFAGSQEAPEPDRQAPRARVCAYSIDVDAAGGAFLTRDLRERLRPIESDFVSPVDGVLR